VVSPRGASSWALGRRGGEALLADESEFIDLANSPLWFAYEYPQVSPAVRVVGKPRSAVVKLHFPLRHPATIGFDEAQLYWRTGHGPLIRSHAEATGMLAYFQVHRFETPLEAALRASRGTVTEPYTGHAEAWFDRGRQAATPEARAAGRAAIADEQRFIDFARSAIWIGKEHVIIDRWA
jgi:hypothetical protein